MIKITFPDGSVREYAEGTTAYQIAESISPRLAADSLAASVNGATTDMTVYQLVVVPERYELWFKLPGVQDWSLIDMRALLKPREE